jgi:purine-nucleoside phosphorylase
MLETIKQTAEYLKQRTGLTPKYGIILGSGLGGLVDEIETLHKIPYTEIPNFPVSTVEGHSGNLIFGNLGGKLVVAMQGRFHFYEGYAMEQVVFPVRVLKYIGVETLFVSNAAGGMNPAFEIGDLMLINDHLNLQPNPLIGPNNKELGLRFPDMSEPYSYALLEKAEKVAASIGIKVQKGVYASVTGPTFETPAEYRWFWRIGADAVGMSTVPEVIVARHMGVECFAVSVITDLGVEGQVHKVSHEEVLQAANIASVKLTKLITELVRTL